MSVEFKTRGGVVRAYSATSTTPEVLEFLRVNKDWYIAETTEEYLEFHSEKFIRVPQEQVEKARRGIPGPGTKLANLFKKHGIEQTTNGCRCAQVQAKMDAWGPNTCLERKEQLASELVESAKEWKENNSTLFSIPKFIALAADIGYVHYDTMKMSVALVEWACRKEPDPPQI